MNRKERNTLVFGHKNQRSGNILPLPPPLLPPHNQLFDKWLTKKVVGVVIDSKKNYRSTLQPPLTMTPRAVAASTGRPCRS